jgi:hypothetical protein
VYKAIYLFGIIVSIFCVVTGIGAILFYYFYWKKPSPNSEIIKYSALNDIITTDSDTNHFLHSEIEIENDY